MIVLYCFFVQLFFETNSVPPDVCFAPFRWDDCGLKPTPVMYYYKPGSRCEVGIWRGCLPNMNMFQDEYECIGTCIFSRRADPEDYHNKLIDIVTDINYDDTTVPDNTTVTEMTDATGFTDTSDVTGTDGTQVTDVTTTDSENSTMTHGTGETTVTEDHTKEDHTASTGEEVATAHASE